MGEWILCSEQMPTPNQYYLITVISETGLTDSIMARRSYNGWDVEVWSEFIHDDDDSDEVIAWMPLPNPYEVK